MNKLNLALIWTCVVTTLSGALWMFDNMAWAADIDRIEVRLIKRDLRELRHELEHEHDEHDRRRLEKYIEELIDDLCTIAPEDREC